MTLPTVLRPVSEQQIRFRVERMLHAPRDFQAISAILASASYVLVGESTQRELRHRLIASPERLALHLVKARSSSPVFVDTLIHGVLHQSLDQIRTGQLNTLPAAQAIRLLAVMTRLWGLHDLQIISARLHRSIYHPTDDFVDGPGAGPQSFQAWAVDPLKMADMAAIAVRLLRRIPGQQTPTDMADERRLCGFVTGTEFKRLAGENRAGLRLFPSRAGRRRSGKCAPYPQARPAVPDVRR